MNKHVKRNYFKKAVAWITVCACLAALSGCLTGKLVTRDKQTGMTVTIEDETELTDDTVLK